MVFNSLLEKVSDELDGCVEAISCVVNSSGSSITPKTKLAVALRFMAGGSYIDIGFAFGIAYRSFYTDDSVLWGTHPIASTSKPAAAPKPANTPNCLGSCDLADISTRELHHIHLFSRFFPE
jgi:hypothetical protein